LAAAGRRRILMANIPSQEKRNHRSERERLENRRRTSTVKTYFHRLERAIESNDSGAAETEYRALVSKIDKAAEHGALHANNAARKKSRAARLRAQLGS
jgi:small subunit ribosomal protein S20